jgi:hypothetical protein
MDAILFGAIEGRWLRGDKFHYPELTQGLPELQSSMNWSKSDPKNARR